MKPELRLLILEDRPADAELMLRELRRAGYEPEWKRVETEPDYLAQLDQGWDIILADYALPQFDGLRALELLQERGLEIPFIIVSGTIGEDKAVAAMKAGATDYLMKANLARLAPAVERELREAAERRERKKAEAALAKSQSLLNSLMDHLPDSIYFKDAESRFLRINRATSDRFGLANPAQALGKTDGDFFAEEHARLAREDEERILQTGQPLVDKEERETWPDRSDTWVSTTKLPLRDEAGKAIGTFGVSRDITERKKAEQTLRESEARYRSLFENLQEGFAYCRMLFEGVPEESAPGSTGYQPVPPGDSPDGMGTASEVYPGAAFTTGAAPIPVGESPTGAGGPPAPPIFRTCSERGQPSDFVYLEVNPAFARLTGLKNVVGKRVSEVIPGIQQSNPKLFEIYGRVASSGKPEKFEVYVEPLRGWFSFSVYSQAREHFVAVFDNITERKEHEEALRHRLELQEQLARIAATVPGMIYSFRMRPDGSMCMPFASPALEEIYGLQLAEVRNDATPILSLIHPDDFPRVNEAIAESARNRKPWREEFRMRTKHRGELWVEGNSMPQLELDGSILWQGFIQDITERRRAAEKLHLQGAALDAAANVIVITDREGVIQWVNPAFTAITNYSFEEAIGKDPGTLLKSGKHDQTFYRKLWDIILSGGVWHGEIINRRKNGSLYTEDLTITPLRNEREEITHFIAIGQDITEKKALEEQFLRAQRLESVGRLAGGIAHDLNNILAPILMMPPLLRQALPEGPAQRLADTIETNAQRGADIVKQMLVFSRGMDGKHLPVQLRTLIRDMLGIIRETFPKNITARSQLAPQAGMVSGDATQLHQVLMNLCVNARDSMPSGGTLTLGLEEMEVDEAFARTGFESRPGRYVVLTVTDTGDGIPAEHLDKIFDPFFTTKEIGEGTGLGLSTVLGIVRSHHGLIQVNSPPGQGTQFRVCLPACESATAGETPTTLDALPQGHGELVLVVDDEDEVRRVTRAILEKNGYRVADAQNGVEALTVLVSQLSEVKAVVTDLMMPYMDGAAFVRAFSHTKSTAKIIVTTGNPSRSRLLDDLQAQVHGFIPKPFRAAALLGMLHQVLHPQE